MLDPGAIGTLIIRRDAERAAVEQGRPIATIPDPGRRRSGVRIVLARALRGAAAVLDRPAIPAPVDER